MGKRKIEGNIYVYKFQIKINKNGLFILSESKQIFFNNCASCRTFSEEIFIELRSKFWLIKCVNRKILSILILSGGLNHQLQVVGLCESNKIQ